MLVAVSYSILVLNKVDYTIMAYALQKGNSLSIEAGIAV